MNSDVRHYTNKLLELMDTMVLDPKWLANSLMGYMSEDDVADFAQYNDYFDVDEIEGGYPTRKATILMGDLMDQGLASPESVVRSLVDYMSEDDVKGFCDSEDLMDLIKQISPEDEDIDDDIDESVVLKDTEEPDDSEIKQWRVPNPLGMETIFVGTEKAAKALCARYGLTPEEVK